MMRALSLTQPWASLVAIGAKRWETRDWPTNFRGEFALHASKSFPVECRDLCNAAVFRDPLIAAGILDARRDESATMPRIRDAFPLGAIIAVARITSSESINRNNTPDGPEYHFGNYGPNRFKFGISDVRPLETPVPCKGALGFWMVPPDVERAVREQLDG